MKEENKSFSQQQKHTFRTKIIVLIWQDSFVNDHRHPAMDLRALAYRASGAVLSRPICHPQVVINEQSLAEPLVLCLAT